jgi:DNA-binding response OmpR family regulator
MMINSEELTKVLLVDDVPEVHLVVRAALGPKFQLTAAVSIREASELVAQSEFSLILLDIGFPGEDGLQFCAQLRNDIKTQDIPVIFLTGKNSTSDKVLGFAKGADDYIVKPIDPPEFLARVEARLRSSAREASLRMNSRGSSSLATEKTHVYSQGSFKIDLLKQKAFLIENSDFRDLRLTANELKLLQYFLRNEEKTLSRDEILGAIWGQDTHVTGRTVDTHIYALRQKLAGSAGVLQSIYRSGYKYSEKDPGVSQASANN